MASTKLARARAAATKARKAAEDERVQFAGGSGVGGAAAAIADSRMESKFFGRTPFAKSLAYGVVGMVAGIMAPRRMPLRAAIVGAGAGAFGAGAYLTTEELLARQEEEEEPT